MAEVNDIMGLVDNKELLDFAQGLDITRDYIGQTLFPDRKHQYLKAAWYQISQAGTLPTVAPVHAFDTEAVIGERASFEALEVENLLIKEKINQTERLQRVKEYGMTQNQLTDFVFDDMANLFDAVVARSELMKMQLLTTGKVVIQENNLDMELDYNVPAGNIVTADWSDPDHDIIGDIITWKRQMTAQGEKPTIALTSDTIVHIISTNKGIQAAIFGASGVGTYPSMDQINSLLMTQAQISLVTNDEMYAKVAVVSGRKTRTTERFLPVDSFVMLAAGTNRRIGEGLWAPTPEEIAALSSNWDENRERQFVTLTQWTTDDPVAVWTKASGVFVPALVDPYSLLAATITLPAEDVQSFAANVPTVEDDNVPEVPQNEGAQNENGFQQETGGFEA